MIKKMEKKGQLHTKIHTKIHTKMHTKKHTKKHTKTITKKNISKYRRTGGNHRDTININEYITTNKGECADFINGGICSDTNILNAVVLAFNDGDDNNKPIDQILNKAKEELNCNSEYCIVTHPEFKKFAIQSHIISNDILNSNLKRFKIKGPRNSTNWLSNYDIDKTLQDWACKFEDFFPCPFAMIDFDRTNDALNRYNLANIYLGKYPKMTILGNIKIPYRTFGCAINTDISTGSGKHWMVLFVDMRGNAEWTIEFFNSAGNGPQKSIVRWMQRTKNELELLIKNINRNIKVTIVPIYKIEHQESNTECGLYTLFYIRCRLEHVPYSRFLEGSEIPDESMIEFRKHCFR